MSTKLTPDAPVPALSLPLLGGGTFTLADQTPQNFTMVVFYRGYHCPLCKMYLTTLNGLMPRWKEAGFEVVAVSMDSEERAKKSVEEWGIGDVPVAHGLTVEGAKAWGLWISESIKEAEAKVFNEPGLVWIRPDGRLYMIDISNMPWARPDLEFMLGKVPFAVDNGYPARGTMAA